MTESRASSFLQMIRRAQRGRLKVYLGYGAGVGKTYQMLLEAQRLRQEGIDVAVGLVETHGRAETAQLLEGLEVLPRKRVEYHGIQVEEMDLEGILARKPQVVLVDELAHTNVPGSRNEKRYQDAQEIRAAGIHVITTLNVQHLESLYNMVEKMIAVRVRERIPDSVLADADQVVNVDLVPEDLQKRLREGKIYPRERVSSALEHFFTVPNLEQLRELTLRELASQIDSKRREVSPEAEGATPDQVMVCLSSRGPNAAHLLRFGSRLAGRLNRAWYAVYVQTPSEEPAAIDATTQRLLSDTLTLANQLGATVFTFKGQDVADTILRFAKEYRVGQIVIGRSGPIAWWKRLLGRRGVAEELIRRGRGATVVVVDAEAEGPQPGPIEGAAALVLNSRSLENLLSPWRIVLWDVPVSREEVLKRLVEVIAAETPEVKLAPTLERLRERESQGSTFLNEGVALPHAFVEGLGSPQVALGLTRAGVLDVGVDVDIEAVFLLLSPADRANLHLQLLSRAARLLQNRELRKRLTAVSTPEEVLAEIRAQEIRSSQARTEG
jgi:two-component system sensor histidine kinase KdpD